MRSEDRSDFRRSDYRREVFSIKLGEEQSEEFESKYTFFLSLGYEFSMNTY